MVLEMGEIDAKDKILDHEEKWIDNAYLLKLMPESQCLKVNTRKFFSIQPAGNEAQVTQVESVFKL
jgi:hypothetical protein